MYRDVDEEEDGLDPSVDWDSRDRQAREIARKVLVKVGAVGVGLAVGGPVGAVVGALTGAAAEPFIERVVDGRRQREVANTGILLNAANDLSGKNPAEVLQWAEKSDERLVFLEDLVISAANSRSERKIMALARVLAAGVDADEDINLLSMVRTAIADLEEPHIGVLKAILTENLPRPSNTRNTKPGFWSQSQLEARFPKYKPALPSILATLERHGLSKEGVSIETGNRAGMMTEFGLLCYDFLRDLNPESRRPT